jgi:ATP-dependent Clp protease protease subunit
MSKNIVTDFRKFAISNTKASSSVVDDTINKVNNGTLTPLILEEREMNVMGLDIFSRLLLDRQVFFGAEFNQDTCNLLVAQLLYLDSVDNRDINIMINSCGGSVIDGLAVIDTMNFIKSDVATSCVGMAASMGALLLSSGVNGKRYILPHGRVMIHQVSSFMKGKFSDMKIEFEQTERCSKDIYTILSKNMGKEIEEVEKLCDRDNWFIGQEAIDIGLCDKLLIRE